MVKEFEHHIAWTDAMKYRLGYAGIIGYQRKNVDGLAHILWVIDPNFGCEHDAEMSAERMLDQITEITSFGRVVYADGVML